MINILPGAPAISPTQVPALAPATEPELSKYLPSAATPDQGEQGEVCHKCEGCKQLIQSTEKFCSPSFSEG